MDELLQKISDVLARGSRRAVFLIPFAEGALVRLLHDEAAVLREDYVETGTLVEAVVKPAVWGRLKDYVKETP